MIMYQQKKTSKTVKKVILAIIISVLIFCWPDSVSGFNALSCGDPWYYQSNEKLTFMVPDKAQHYYGSYVLSEICGKVLSKKRGAYVAFIFGFLWEIRDSKTSLGNGVVGFSYRDLIADGLGVISSLVNNEKVVMYVDYSTIYKEITFNVIVRW